MAPNGCNGPTEGTVEHTTRTRFRAQGSTKRPSGGQVRQQLGFAAVPLCYVAKRSPVPPRQPDMPPSDVLTDGQNASIRSRSGLGFDLSKNLL
jgi:hypothetical protein